MEIKINDRSIEAREGERLIDAALRHGIEIPHFCYHPHLSIAGNCRMCLVKVESVPKLMPACNMHVAANMKVDTAAPEVARARQMIMQFLMLNHPVDCGICDKAGECRLQDYEFEYGVPRSRSLEPKHRKRKLYALSERIQLDNERCILCSRCVRFTREVSKSNMLGIVERGGHAMVDRAVAERRGRSLFRQRHRPVPHRRAAVERLSLQEPQLVPRTRALGMHGLCARLQRQHLAPQERVAAALARRRTQPRWRTASPPCPTRRSTGPGSATRASTCTRCWCGNASPMRGSAACRRALDQAVDRARTLLAAGKVAGRHGLGAGFQRRARRVCRVGQSTRPAPAHLCARRLSRRAR